MDVIAGRYEVEREIGRGGMGVVLLARDSTLGRRVALKRLTLDPLALENEEATRRFMREARLTSQLSHPCIVSLIDVLEDGGDLYLILEYYESESLSAKIRRTGPLNETEARKVGAQVASALGYAHGEGVVHRDVKPDNILLGAQGAKLTDFGIARLSEGKQDSDTKLTQTGYYVGTPGYMSPEQIKGDSASAASDVFSVGLVVYYALTGEEPFGSGGPAAVLYRIVHEPLDLGGLAISEDLRQWIAAASAKDPSQRPGASMLAAGLDPSTAEAPAPLPQPVQTAGAAPVADSSQFAPATGPVTEPTGAAGHAPSSGGPLAPGAPPQAPYPPGPTLGTPQPAPMPGASPGSSHAAAIAVLVGVLVLAVVGVVGLFVMRGSESTSPAVTDYSSPQGFTVQLPAGWTGEHSSSDRTDRFANSDDSANVFVSKIGPSRDDLQKMAPEALIEEYVKRELQLEGKLQLKEDIVTVNKNSTFGNYDAVQFEFEVVDSSNKSRYSAELYVFSGGDSLWAVLYFAPRGTFENSRGDFNDFESTFTPT